MSDAANTAASNASLSVTARLSMVLAPCLVSCWLYMTSAKAALLSPFVFLPTYGMYYVWALANRARPEHHGQLETMVWIYFSVSIIGTTLLGLTQLLAYLLLVSVVMGDRASEYWTEFLRGTVEGMLPEERAKRANLAFTWQNWLLTILFSFVMAGGFEETLKYLPVAYAKRSERVSEKKHRNIYLDYALAGSLGIATVECIGFLHDTYANGIQSMLELIVTLAQRLVAGTAGHLSTAILTALRATRSNFYGPQQSSLWIIIPSVIIHGIGVMTVFVSCTLDGHVGWVHPTELISIAGMYGFFFCVVCVGVILAYREHKLLNLIERRRQ